MPKIYVLLKDLPTVPKGTKVYITNIGIARETDGAIIYDFDKIKIPDIHSVSCYSIDYWTNQLIKSGWIERGAPREIFVNLYADGADDTLSQNNFKTRAAADAAVSYDTKRIACIRFVEDMDYKY